MQIQVKRSLNQDETHDSKINRINEFDFLKFIFIILMIVFHLVYIGDLYPYVKKIVYTFHMPAFLFISGYLLNINKKWTAFLRTIKWIFIPYSIMECGYVVMASLLPINEHIDHLTLFMLVNKITVHPLGPYWYLHTLMLCGILYYSIFQIMHIKDLSRFIVFGLCLYVCSRYLHIVSFYCACYFFAGAITRQSGTSFLHIIQPSALSFIPVIFIVLYPQNLDKSTIAGVAMVYLVMSISLFVFKYTKGMIRQCSLFIGRNTLILLLFSPIFTILAKLFLPFLGFDPSGMLFLVLALLFTLTGSFLIAYTMDKLNISRFFFGKDRIIQ